MSRFDRLIERSEASLPDKDSFVNKFRYPGLFISSLKELKELVGNDRIKDSLASQIMYLISNKHDDKNINAQSPMINTLLYGPPGTGKTAIAVKISKIWYAMGIIGNDIKDRLLSISDNITSTADTLIYIYVICVFTIAMVKFITSAISNLNLSFSFSLYHILAILFIIICLVLIVYLSYNNRLNNSTVKDSEIVTIVSREDFVDKYLGGTDKKTKSLLINNTGKVLFIDEAYSLFNGESDPYGMEALTTLNRYLSENSDKIVVIMAGYKDLIRDKIFSNQPGLRSRFMWHFECNGYSARELYRIFLVMLRKDNWTIVKDHKPLLLNLISENISSFRAFARDIQRLLFFSKLEHSESFVMDTNINPRELTISMIERGMHIFVQNDSEDLHVTDNNPVTDSESIKDLLKSLVSNQKTLSNPNISQSSTLNTHQLKETSTHKPEGNILSLINNDNDNYNDNNILQTTNQIIDDNHIIGNNHLLPDNYQIIDLAESKSFNTLYNRQDNRSDNNGRNHIIDSFKLDDPSI